MTTESLKETIRRELPGWLREDEELRSFILELTRREYAGRVDTEDRFYAILADLQRDREAQARKWDEQTRKWEEHQAEQRAEFNNLYEQANRDREEQARKWDEQNRKWEEENRKWEEENRKWDGQSLKWEEQNLKWEEQNRKWDKHQAEQRAEFNNLYEQANRDREEQARKWEANQEELRHLHEEIMAQAQKYDRSIGALGARWGTQSEKAFRDALASILEKSFSVQVVNVTEFDDEGEVFGRPEQVELDVIVKNGLLLICELKSSIDKAGMYIFERKARFYERHHKRQANRLIVISPMIDARAQKVADRLGIETFGDSSEVKTL